jgi:CRP/FNR family transcriptional regulator, cyclic AMP receptor protein
VSDAEFLHTPTPAESEALEQMGEPGSYPPGSLLFEQGDTADRVLLVRAGHVRVAARGADGSEVGLAERGPGDLAAIDGRPRSATVTAVDEVRALVVLLCALRGFLMDHPRAALALLELLSRRLREAEAQRVA